jgi:hypothetical protein
MTSGLACDSASDVEDLNAMWGSEDWVEFSLDRPVVTEPGAEFAYCGPSIHLLSPILQQATGLSALEFGRQYLFGPLGIDDVVWSSDPQGYTRGWGDLALFPQDAAKLGLLMLQGGRWDGQQILSKEWVEAATTVQTDTNRGQHYGYAWWLPETENEMFYFSADGRGGQYITVIPEMNAVIATTGGGFDDRDDAFAILAAALGDPGQPLPANPQGEAELQAAVEQIGRSPSPKAVPAQPEIAGKISGRVYVFEPNPLGLEWMSLGFDDSSEAMAQIKLGDEESPRTIPIGLDGTLHRAPLRGGYVGGAQGEWLSDDAFRLEYNEIARIDQWSMQLDFRGDTLTVHFGGPSMPQMIDIVGTAQ